MNSILKKYLDSKDKVNVDANLTTEQIKELDKIADRLQVDRADIIMTIIEVFLADAEAARKLAAQYRSTKLN